MPAKTVVVSHKWNQLNKSGLWLVMAIVCLTSLTAGQISATEKQDNIEKVTVAGSQAVDQPIKALMITGGCCHDYDRQKLILSQGINARIDVDWTIVHQGGNTTDTKIAVYENKNWADGYDVVVHNECFAKVTDPDWAERILQPHREGVPALLIHCAMHCYRVGDDRWFEFCGIESPKHGPKYPFLVENITPEHPIMKNFGADWLTPQGELYYSVRVFDSATPLAVAKRSSDNEPQVCVWTNQYQRGRVFATTIGHHNETMAQPEYLNLLSRGMLWAVDQHEKKTIRVTTAETDRQIIQLIDTPLETTSQLPEAIDCCGREISLKD